MRRISSYPAFLNRSVANGVVLVSSCVSGGTGQYE
jgi:hypothetical protein